MKRKPGAGRPPLDNPPTVVHIALRLYPGQDDDLKTWLLSLPEGYMSAAVKARLRSGKAAHSLAEVFAALPDDDLDAAFDTLIL